MARTRSSSMSNAKWRKALMSLTRTVPDAWCRWKLLRHETPEVGWLPDPDGICESDARETCGCPLFHFADVEWFEIAAERTHRAYDKAPLTRVPQAVFEAEAELRKLGQFDLELLPEGLRIYGYRT